MLTVVLRMCQMRSRPLEPAGLVGNGDECHQSQEGFGSGTRERGISSGGNQATEEPPIPPRA